MISSCEMRLFFSWIQDSLTDAQTLWGDLQQLILVDEFQCLLQAENLRRNQLQCLIRGRGTGVGQVLGLTDVQLDILGFSVLSDHHTAVNLFAGADE